MLTRREWINAVINRHLPYEVRWVYELISYSARRTHLNVQGGIGSGKTSFLSAIAYADLLLSLPIVLIDPTGSLTNYLLMLIINSPPDIRAILLRRIRYIDMSGQTSHVVSLPIYYRLGSEALDQIAARLLNVIDRMNPELINAPISGKYSINMVGKLASSILISLGLSITEMYSLLTDTASWTDTLRALGNKNPAAEVQEAVRFFTTEYLKDWKFSADGRTIAFKQRIFDLTFSDRNRAIFSGSTSGIDFQEITEHRLCAIFDCSTELDPEIRRFKMNWILENLTQSALYSGTQGRDNPTSVILDETSAYWRTYSQVEQMNQFLNIDARNFGFMVTGAHQSSNVLDPAIDATWRESPTTQIAGSLRSHQTAMAFAELYHLYDEKMVQHYNKQWVQASSGSTSRTKGTSKTESITSHINPLRSPGNSESKMESETTSGTSNTYMAIDQIPIFHTVEQQRELTANKFNLSNLNFYCKVARWEGDGIGVKRDISLQPYIKNMQPNHEKLVILKQWLIEQSGVPREQILREIEARKAHLFTGDTSQFTPPVTANSIETNRYEEVDDDDPLFRK
jgi:hypothetical protein